VEVRLIMAGKSDMPILRYAERYLYDSFLREGVKIYEWNNSVMHGKAMLMDHRWVTIGSFNLNYLSHYRSIELNVDILDPGFAKIFTTHLERMMKENCTRILAGDHSLKENWWRRTRNKIAYWYLVLILKLFVRKKTTPLD